MDTNKNEAQQDAQFLVTDSEERTAVELLESREFRVYKKHSGWAVLGVE